MTTESRLAFCTLRQLAPDLIETIMSEGVEVSREQVLELHRELARLAQDRPFAVLVTKLNSYTYSFGAQQEAFKQPLLRALAYHAPDPTRRFAVESLLAVVKTHLRVPIEIFGRREEALSWLRQQMDAADSKTAPR